MELRPYADAEVKDNWTPYHPPSSSEIQMQGRQAEEEKEEEKPIELTTGNQQTLQTKDMRDSAGNLAGGKESAKKKAVQFVKEDAGKEE